MGTITLRALRENDRLVLTIADNGLGLSPDALGKEPKLGIGLSSTRERLDKMYPGQHEFVIRNLDQGGTEVRIAIPFRQRHQDRPTDAAPEETVPSEQPAIADR